MSESLTTLQSSHLTVDRERHADGRRGQTGEDINADRRRDPGADQQQSDGPPSHVLPDPRQCICACWTSMLDGNAGRQCWTAMHLRMRRATPSVITEGVAQVSLLQQV